MYLPVSHMLGHRRERTKPITVLKSVGPKLVPYFKTLTIYFVLFGYGSRLESPLYCVVKCAPIVSLMFFVLLHGMSFSEYYSYSRKILAGLFFSCAGDAFMVWKSTGYFMHGVVAFAIAQFFYAWAFGLRPLSLKSGAFWTVVAAVGYSYIYPGLEGPMVYFVLLYISLICTMAWRAVARVEFFGDLWTWTKLCAFAGAVCFLVSDLVIAVDRFRHQVPYAHQIIMVTYYAAQLGIALSVVDSQVDALLQHTSE